MFHCLIFQLLVPAYLNIWYIYLDSKVEVTTNMLVNCTAATNISNGTFGLNYTINESTIQYHSNQYSRGNVLQISVVAKIAIVCLCATIFVLGVTGNAAVCFVIGNYVLKRYSINFFLLMFIFLSQADTTDFQS